LKKDSCGTNILPHKYTFVVDLLDSNGRLKEHGIDSDPLASLKGLVDRCAKFDRENEFFPSDIVQLWSKTSTESKWHVGVCVGADPNVPGGKLLQIAFYDQERPYDRYILIDIETTTSSRFSLA